MFGLIDELIQTPISPAVAPPENAFTTNNFRHLSVRDLKNVLDKRGVLYDHVFERDELEFLALISGPVTWEEVAAATQANHSSASTLPEQNPDARVHKIVSSARWRLQQDIRVEGAKSVVFDSESVFVELVDDNKDSVWLLAVITSSTDSSISSNSIVSSTHWGQLTQTLAPFGFKFGLIFCQKLPSVCHDRGFIAADLVLALPKGGDRIKDSVQFRPFPRGTFRSQPVSNSAFKDPVLQTIRIWLWSVLSERVSPLTDAEHIQSSTLSWSSWFWQRPPPLHVIWKPPSSTFRSQSNELLAPPLLLSALSVPFTGRVKFWTLITPSKAIVPPGSDNADESSWPLAHRPSQPIGTFLERHGCDLNAVYLLLTPEVNCQVFGSRNGEFLHYKSFETFLRFLYPSADDCLCLFVSVINLLVVLNSAIEAGKLASNKQRDRVNFDVQETTIDRRLRMLRSLLSFPRRGWQIQTPPMLDTSTESVRVQASYLSRLLHQCSPRYNRFTLWLTSLFVDLLSVNFLILISVLPLINLLSLPHAAPLVNLFLFSLRKLVTFPFIVALRIQLVGGHFTLERFLIFVAFWCSILSLVSFHFFSVAYLHNRSTRSRRRTRSSLLTAAIIRRLHDAAPEELRNDLQRLLHSDMLDTHSDSSSMSNNDDLSPPSSSIAWQQQLSHGLPDGHYPPIQAEQFPIQPYPPIQIHTWRFRIQSVTRDTTRNATKVDDREPNILPHQIVSGSLSSVADVCESPSPLLSTSECPSAEGAVRRRVNSSDSRRSSLSSLDSDSCSSSPCRSYETTSNPSDSYRVEPPSWILHCDSCVICWRAFKARALMGGLPCGHCFHKACIVRWINTGATDCPVCRWPVNLPHSRQRNHCFIAE